MAIEIAPSALLAPRQSVKDSLQDHPGYGATLETLLAVHRRAELGRPSQQCDLYDDLIHRDAALFGLVNARRAAISGRPAAIVAGGKDADSEKAAEAFAEVWDRLPAFALVAHQAHCSNAYGYACTEIEWQWNPDDQRYDPVDLYRVRSRLFRIATEFDPVVLGAQPDELLVRVGLYEHEVERMVPGKWIVTRRSESEPVARCSLMRPSSIYSILKSQGYAGWFSFLNRYGVPFLQIDVKDGSPETLAVAERMLAAWGSDLGVVLPKSSGIEPKVIDGAQISRNAGSDVHQRWVQELNIELTRIWNGGVLASEASTGTGTYAQAKVHEGIRLGNVLEDADRVQESIRRGMIIPWMRVNGIPGKPPKVVIKLGNVQDPQLAVTLAKDLDAIGLEVDPGQLTEITGLILKRKEKPAAPAEGERER